MAQASKHFFVTGLPRSRTAWLANLLTTDRTLCFHEPIEPIDKLFNPAWAGGYAAIGCSDSMLVMRFEELSDAYLQAPWLYVQRDPEAALNSLLAFSLPHVDLSEEAAREFIIAECK